MYIFCGMKLNSNIFLAPLAGYADAGFRSVCRELDAGFTYTEMISVISLARKIMPALEMLKVEQNELPYGVQLFGKHVESYAIAAELLNSYPGVGCIDVNMGCSVRKVSNRGEGVGLMSTPELATEIVSRMKAVTHLPVTAKIRKGWDENSINAVEFAKRLEQAGLNAITVHGRTKVQRFQGVADWDIIRDVKKAVNIPVIGNGDVRTPEDAKRMLAHTGCDAVMIGRAAVGNPWLFRQIKELVETGKYTLPAAKDKLGICVEQYKKTLKYVNPQSAVFQLRKHVFFYIRGLDGAAEVRQRISVERSWDAVLMILAEYLHKFE
ncbi:MAG: tRNA dihydrouridine synthase DusB [Elusimicrobiota bacterium]